MSFHWCLLVQKWQVTPLTWGTIADCAVSVHLYITVSITECFTNVRRRGLCTDTSLNGLVGSTDNGIKWCYIQLDPTCLFIRTGKEGGRMHFEQSEKRPRNFHTSNNKLKSHNLLFNDVLKTTKAELNINLFKYFNDLKSHIKGYLMSI